MNVRHGVGTDALRCFFTAFIVSLFQIAIQVAVLISKIVRIETREWPELFPLLLKVCLLLSRLTASFISKGMDISIKCTLNYL